MMTLFNSYNIVRSAYSKPLRSSFKMVKKKVRKVAKFTPHHEQLVRLNTFDYSVLHTFPQNLKIVTIYINTYKLSQNLSENK